ncbi:MAG: aspartate carbamoyltransferase [Candidatus Aenigmarchaeota archaeon]|nr:aspartate carbamoyltransferase [Candidatus Aenigmarchaeota archaeon]
MVEIGWRGHRHLLSIDDFSREELEAMLNAANVLTLDSDEGQKLDILKGFILKPVFFEPSSRTQNSFEAAMLSMGGSNLSPHLTITSSMEKGETEQDTITTYAQYSDFLVVRHPRPNSVREFAITLDKQGNRARVINAGDGSNEHPTQALLDLYTVMKEFKELDGVTYLLLGDLKYGRTVHSLVLGARKFDGVSFVGFPVGGLSLSPQYRQNGYNEHDISDFRQFLETLPRTSRVVIYATRVQWERIARERYENFDQFDEKEKARIRSEIYKELNYQVTAEHLAVTPDLTTLLHPLPRGSEIADELFYSNQLQVAPIRQMRYGLPVRMAALGLYGGKEKEIFELPKGIFNLPAHAQV